MRTANAIEAQASEQQPAEQPRKYKPGHNPNSRKNLVAPWKPGDVPNPTGKNGHDLASEVAKAIFSENGEEIYKAMTKALLKGNAYAFTQIAERAYGKLVEKKELTGANGGPLEYKEVNERDLNERIAQLERDLGLARAIDEAGRVGSAQARTEETAAEAEDQKLLSR